MEFASHVQNNSSIEHCRENLDVSSVLCYFKVVATVNALVPVPLPLQVADFTNKVNSYVMNSVMFFKSMWPEVKCNAALFVGEYTV